MGISTTFSSYDAVGLREDVSDIITNITPTKTPFQTIIGREKVTQRWFQWQEDSLRATATAAAPNARPEGFTAVNPNAVATIMRDNTTQILSETVQVSGSMEATSTYGRAREAAYQMSKSAMQVKRDLEVSLCGFYQAKVSGQGPAGSSSTTPQNQYFAPSGSANTARTFANFAPLVNNPGTGLPAGVNVVAIAKPTTGNTTGASLLTEAALLQSLQNCYNNGAEPNTIMVTPMDSLAVAGFAASAGRYRQFGPNGDSQKLVNAINLYVSPFGEQKVILNRFLKNNAPAAGTAWSTVSVGTTAATSISTWTLIMDPSMWALVTFRSWFREVLAKTGDFTQQQIVGEFSLKHKNFGASSAIVQCPDTTWAGAGW